MKRLSLELGGKNPALVFEDANMEQAVATLIRASFLNQAGTSLAIQTDGFLYYHIHVIWTPLSNRTPPLEIFNTNPVKNKDLGHE